VIGAVSPIGQSSAWSSQLANRHDVYLGRRSTKIHLAAYRRTAGRLAAMYRAGRTPGSCCLTIAVPEVG
jgi:hypothetical protein